MRALPLSIGTIHFVGIGGIGMSGIAEVLHTLGYSVQGSDISDSANVRRLRDEGIAVAVGHDAANLGNAQVVVVSTAVRPDNPEVRAARTRLIPVVRRAEMLAELMRLRWAIAVGGTHGKTTTTSLIAAVLEGAKLDPTVINGGIINAYGTNTRLGSGDWMVVEADESDGSFLRLPATIAVVTNMDAEHLDHWGTAEAMAKGYEHFVQNIPFYGFAVLCIDHPAVQQMIPLLSDRRIITYGFSPQADVRADKLVPGRNGASFEVIVADRTRKRTRTMGPFHLPMLGSHNVQNALAAIAIASEMEIDNETLRSALATFKGVKRRFTKTGEAGGITVIDDYGHHPVEIAAVLKAARQAGARDVVAVVQPHRYTRLATLFEEFCTCMNDAGTVIVADVYAAGEAPIEGVNRDALVEGLRERGHRSVVPLGSPDHLAEMVHAIARAGDYVVCLGAGNITAWAATLPEQLAKLQAVTPRRAGGRAMMAADDTLHLLDRLPPLRGRAQRDVVLAPTTWFRVGGPAEVVVRPADADDLCAFLAALPSEIPVLAIGAASNLIVRDGGVHGVVIRLARGFNAIEADGDGLVAGAAALDLTVAEHAAAAGLSGLEFLSGIPGTIGGAVAMNAGAYGSDMSACLDWAEIVTRDGALLRLDAGKLALRYRHASLPPGAVVVRARLRARPGDPMAIAARMADIRSAREATQPVRARTGGSTFRNPPADQSSHKAWELIDAAGCRGLVRGGAQVSEKHCNFLLNTGNATAADIEGLGEDVRTRVRTASGVLLEWEIKRIGIPGGRAEGAPA